MCLADQPTGRPCSAQPGSCDSASTRTNRPVALATLTRYAEDDSTAYVSAGLPRAAEFTGETRTDTGATRVRLKLRIATRPLTIALAFSWIRGRILVVPDRGRIRVSSDCQAATRVRSGVSAHNPVGNCRTQTLGVVP